MLAKAKPKDLDVGLKDTTLKTVQKVIYKPSFKARDNIIYLCKFLLIPISIICKY